MKFRKYIAFILAIALFLPLISGFSLPQKSLRDIDTRSLADNDDSLNAQTEDEPENENQTTSHLTLGGAAETSSTVIETEITDDVQENQTNTTTSSEIEESVVQKSLTEPTEDKVQKRAANLAEGKESFSAPHLDGSYSISVHTQNFADDVLNAENQNADDYQILSQMEYRIEYDKVTGQAIAITWFYKQYTSSEAEIINAFVTDPDGGLLRAEISEKEISYEESIQENIELAKIQEERELNQDNPDYFRPEVNIERKQPQEKGFYLTKLITPILNATDEESEQVYTLDIITRFQGKNLAQRFSVDPHGALLLPFADTDTYSVDDYAQNTRREFSADETAKSAGIAKSIRKTVGNLNVSEQDQIYGMPLLLSESNAQDPDHSDQKMAQAKDILIRVFELSDMAEFSEIKQMPAAEWNSADPIKPGQLYYSSLVEQIKTVQETDAIEKTTHSAETENNEAEGKTTVDEKTQIEKNALQQAGNVLRQRQGIERQAAVRNLPYEIADPLGLDTNSYEDTDGTITNNFYFRVIDQFGNPVANTSFNNSLIQADRYFGGNSARDNGLGSYSYRKDLRTDENGYLAVPSRDRYYSFSVNGWSRFGLELNVEGSGYALGQTIAGDDKIGSYNYLGDLASNIPNAVAYWELYSRGSGDPGFYQISYNLGGDARFRANYDEFKYQKDGTPYNFNDGHTYYTNNRIEDYTIVLIKDQDISFTNVNEADQPVQGARFLLSKIDGKTFSRNVDADASGHFTFTGLSPGKYELRQMTAPKSDGSTQYVKIQNIALSFTINSVGQIVNLSNNTLTSTITDPYKIVNKTGIPDPGIQIKILDKFGYPVQAAADTFTGSANNLTYTYDQNTGILTITGDGVTGSDQTITIFKQGNLGTPTDNSFRYNLHGSDIENHLATIKRTLIDDGNQKAWEYQVLKTVDQNDNYRDYQINPLPEEELAEITYDIVSVAVKVKFKVETIDGRSVPAQNFYILYGDGSAYYSQYGSTATDKSQSTTDQNGNLIFTVKLPTATEGKQFYSIREKYNDPPTKPDGIIRRSTTQASAKLRGFAVSPDGTIEYYDNVEVATSRVDITRENHANLILYDVNYSTDGQNHSQGPIFHKIDQVGNPVTTEWYVEYEEARQYYGSNGYYWSNYALNQELSETVKAASFAGKIPEKNKGEDKNGYNYYGLSYRISIYEKNIPDGYELPNAIPLIKDKGYLVAQLTIRKDYQNVVTKNFIKNETHNSGTDFTTIEGKKEFLNIINRKKVESNLRAPLVFKVGTYDKVDDTEHQFTALPNAGFRLYKGGTEIINPNSTDGLWYPDSQGDLTLAPLLDSTSAGLKPNIVDSREYYTLVQDEAHMPFLPPNASPADRQIYAPTELNGMQRHFRIEDRAGELYVSILEFDEQGLEIPTEYPYTKTGTDFNWTYPSGNFPDKQSYERAIAGNHDLGKGFFLYEPYQVPQGLPVFRIKSNDPEGNFIYGATFTLYRKDGDRYIEVPREVKKLDEQGEPLKDEQGNFIWQTIKGAYTSDALGYFPIQFNTDKLPDTTEFYLLQNTTQIGYQLPKNEEFNGKSIVASFTYDKTQGTQMAYPTEQEANQPPDQPVYIIRNDKATPILDFVSIGYDKEMKSEKLAGVEYQLMNEKGEYYFFDTTKNKDPLTGNYYLKKNPDGSLFVKPSNYTPRIGEELARFVSDAQGNFKVGSLENGRYVLQQMNRQQDYYPLTEKAAQFIVSNNRITSIYPTKRDEDQAYILPQYKDGYVNFTILKLDEKTNRPLSDAYFDIYDQQGRKVNDTPLITDTNGNIFLKGLLPGNLTLNELRAPDGYRLADGMQHVELIDPNKDFAIPDVAGKDITDHLSFIPEGESIPGAGPSDGICLKTSHNEDAENETLLMTSDEAAAPVAANFIDPIQTEKMILQLPIKIDYKNSQTDYTQQEWEDLKAQAINPETGKVDPQLLGDLMQKNMVKPGDYFYLNIGDNVNPHGLNRGENAVYRITGSYGTIAKGFYEPENHRIKFVLTEYFMNRENSVVPHVDHVQFGLPLYIDLEKVQTDSTQTIQQSLGDIKHPPATGIINYYAKVPVEFHSYNYSAWGVTNGWLKQTDPKTTGDGQNSSAYNLGASNTQLNEQERKMQMIVYVNKEGLAITPNSGEASYLKIAPGNELPLIDANTQLRIYQLTAAGTATYLQDGKRYTTGMPNSFGVNEQSLLNSGFARKIEFPNGDSGLGTATSPEGITRTVVTGNTPAVYIRFPQGSLEQGNKYIVIFETNLNPDSASNQIAMNNTLGSGILSKENTIRFSKGGTYGTWVAFSEAISITQEKAVLSVYNTPTQVEFFKKSKVGDELIALSGGEFKLFSVDTNGKETLIQDKIAAEQKSGRIYFEGLSAGRYKLYEIKAPEGYQRPENSDNPKLPPLVATFTIDRRGKVTYETPTDGIILNYKKYELPTTGGIGVYWLTLSGTFLTTLSGGFIIKQNRGKRKGRYWEKSK